MDKRICVIGILIDGDKAPAVAELIRERGCGVAARQDVYVDGGNAISLIARMDEGEVIEFTQEVNEIEGARITSSFLS